MHMCMTTLIIDVLPYFNLAVNLVLDYRFL